MVLHEMLTPTLVAAIVSAIVTTALFYVNRSTTIALKAREIDSSLALAEKRIDADIALAKSKFDYECAQVVFRRKFDLAEKMLSDAYQFKDIMRDARSGISFRGEGEQRVPDGLESPNTKSTRDSYYVPIARLNQQAPFFADMFARQPAFKAHFGNDGAVIFSLFLQSINEVKTVASVLIDMTRDGISIDEVAIKGFRGKIWQPLEKNEGEDEIGDRVDQGVAICERLCSPVLRRSAQI